jgi:hypothetical protein
LCHYPGAAPSRRSATHTSNEDEAVNHAIYIVDGMMCVMDEDGNGYDAHELTGYRDAKRQIQKWTAEYAIDVAASYRLLSEHFTARK